MVVTVKAALHAYPALEPTSRKQNMADLLQQDRPLISLTDNAGRSPLGEMVSKEGQSLPGRLVGMRIWSTQGSVHLPVQGVPMIFFHIEIDGGQMMVPLDEIAAIRLSD